MKTFLALTLLSLSGLSFAETCFKATSSVPSEYKRQIPEVICVQEYGFEFSNVSNAADLVKATTDLGALTGYSRVRPMEASNTVSARTTFYEKSEQGCGNYLGHTLKLNFLVDANGQNIDDSLEVSVETNSAHDHCHSRMRSETIRFDKI